MRVGRVNIGAGPSQDDGNELASHRSPPHCSVSGNVNQCRHDLVAAFDTCANSQAALQRIASLDDQSRHLTRADRAESRSGTEWKNRRNRPPSADLIELPVLPLRDVVVFPHMVIPLFVGREKSVRALDIAMEGNKKILLVAQRSPDVDEPRAGDLYSIGTVASVLQLLKLPDGTIKVLVEGTTRAEIVSFRRARRPDGRARARARAGLHAQRARDRRDRPLADDAVRAVRQALPQDSAGTDGDAGRHRGSVAPRPTRSPRTCRCASRTSSACSKPPTSPIAWNCWSAWSTARSTCSRSRSASAAASSRRWRRASASTTSTSR